LLTNSGDARGILAWHDLNLLAVRGVPCRGSVPPLASALLCPNYSMGVG
jgi:hypothetical protein